MIRVLIHLLMALRQVFQSLFSALFATMRDDQTGKIKSVPNANHIKYWVMVFCFIFFMTVLISHMFFEI